MRRKLRVLLVVLSALTTGVVNLGSPTVTRSAPPPPVLTAELTEVYTAPARLVQARDISCPSATTCILASNPPATSADGGATWTAFRLSPFDITGLATVDCWSSTTCIALDYSSRSYLTFDGGLSWTSSPAPPGNATTVRCFAEFHCVALGYDNTPNGAIWTTDDGSDTWVRRSSEAASRYLQRLSCTSEGFCLATHLNDSQLLTSPDGGVTWATITPAPGGPLGEVAVGCATATTCVAFADAVFAVSTDAGASWATLPYSAAASWSLSRVSAVACPSETRCIVSGYLAGGAPGISTFDPRSPVFSPVTVPAGIERVDKIDCADLSCVAVGIPPSIAAADGGVEGRVIRSDDGGTTWARTGPTTSAEILRSLDCISHTVCIAVGETDRSDPTAHIEPFVKRSDDGGTTWHNGLPPSGFRRFEDVACVPGGSCVAAGRLSTSDTESGIARSTDQGRTWTRATIDAPLGFSVSMTCLTGGVCFTASWGISGSHVLRSTDSGATWQTVTTSPHVFNSIECQSSMICLVSVHPGGPEGPGLLWRTLDGGTTWQTGTPPGGAADRIEIVHCSVERCIAVAGSTVSREIYATVDAGASWSSLSGERPFSKGGMACTGNMCVYSIWGYQTVLFVSDDGGLSWRKQGTADFRQISPTRCISAGVCLGIGVGGSGFGTAIVRIDLALQYAPPTLVGLVPARLLETRTGPGMTTTDRLFEGGGLASAGSTTTLRVAGRGGVAADAASAVLNVTVTEPAGPGFLTVFPCGQPRPLASNVNFTAGATVANAVVAKLAADGTVCIFASAATHLVVDTTGYMPAAATSLIGVTPARLMETRTRPGMTTIDQLHQGGGTMTARVTRPLPVAGRGGVAVGAGSAVLNVTVTEPTAPGFITVYPCDQARPLASSVNFTAGATVANTVIAKLSPDGRVCIYSSATTHLVVDTTGYVPGSATSIVGLLPARLLETRSGPGMSTVDGLLQGGGIVSPIADVRVRIAGRGGVVADAGSALLNVTVTEPADAGFITVYPCDQPRPLASSVNFTAGATVANAVITKLAADGTVCLHTSVPTHLVVDVNGYAE